MLGHADLISSEQIDELRNDYPNVNLANGFLILLIKKVQIMKEIKVEFWIK